MAIYGADQVLGILARTEYGLVDIPFDVVTAEQHSFKNTVTEHKREDGTVFSDHVQNNNRSGTITGIISDYSVYSTKGSSSSISSLSLSDVYDANGMMSTGTRSQRAYSVLRGLWLAKAPVDIVTTMQVYKGVAIVDISVPRSVDDTNSIEFTIEFKEIPMVKLLKYTVSSSALTADTKTTKGKQTSPKANAGTQ